MARYEAAEFFLLRAPALPVGTFRELMADPERLLALARNPYVRRALLVASPDLVAAVDRGDLTAPGKAERVRSRLMRYLIRMATRPTPFGAFSGVAMGLFGARSTAALGSSAIAKVRVRADMGWLMALIKKIEQDEVLLPHLDVVANATLHRVGDRMVLPYADVYGEQDNRAVRIRATPAVDLVVSTAATPVPYATVVSELAAAYPQVPAETVTRLVRELWDLNVLTSDLRPPLTEPHPEQHLLKRLIGVPEAASVTEPLEEIVDLARAADDTAGLIALEAAQRRLLPEYKRHTYQLDAAVSAREPYLSAEVGSAVAGAMDCLMRLAGTAPDQLQHIAEYRDAFLERYGHEARVPLLELLGSDGGMEAPTGYTEPARSYDLRSASRPESSRYDRVISELAAHAWWTGADEVELTDEWVDRLAGSASARPPLPAVDVFAQVSAASLDDIDRGDWQVVLSSVGLAPGGRTYGRFFDLLDDGAEQRLREYARREEALFPDAVFAELAYLPSRGRFGNVAFRPLLRPYEVPINTTPAVSPDRVIDLADIMVGATDQRMYLWSRRLGKELVVTQNHMLSPAVAPNISRFLIEVSQDGFLLPMGFRWGYLEAAPFLPRVRRGKVILRSAQWTVRTLGEDWREKWRVPRHVLLCDNDNKLLLDLDNPAAEAELRREIDRTGQVVLQELRPDFDGLWLRDEQDRPYTAEIVVPVVLEEAPRKRRISPQPDLPAQRFLPGGDWSFLKVYAAFERHDEIIAGPLRELVAALRAAGLIDRWFYMRYADPRPHLRVRCRGAASELLPALTAWGSDLVRRGLANDLQVATYEPELARYGGTRTFDLAERFFEANSDVTADLIARQPDIQAEHLAVATVDTLCALWGLAPIERIAAVPAYSGEDDSHRRFREHHAYLCELLVPNERRPHAQGRADRELLAAVLGPQGPAARDVADAVRAAAADGELAGTEQQVLNTLMHMQINRLLPIDLNREGRCYALWHHALRAIRGRLVAEA
ncbi:lantibiotic dehydratase [Nonomuraea sp. NPDC003804]|uniref:lantibiotic dehydratase n=1 Tax=Nonomuraea sp. NPDC003804 TaxID=3154547 RepID=UPI0033BD9231